MTPVFRALEHFAAALRYVSDKDFYHKSRTSTKITTFWSHSWHGGRWKKILTVVSLYNGPAAVSLAFLTGLLMMVLFSFGALPGINRGWWVSHWEWSCWSTSSGLVVASVVLTCWRSQTRVFLDRICISQNDDRLKSEAILSLAGLLKNSDSMLVLWDPTWTERWDRGRDKPSQTPPPPRSWTRKLSQDKAKPQRPPNLLSTVRCFAFET